MPDHRIAESQPPIAHRPPVHIGQVIRNAIVFNPKNQRDAPLDAENLILTVNRLFALLHERQIDYLLVGGVAMLQYVEGRNTEDIDLIMALSSLDKIPEIHITSRDRWFSRGAFETLQIDILLTENPLFEKAIRKYATHRPFVEQEIFCTTVEGLLLLKLYALPSLYRQGNFARVGIYENDIATLMHAYQPQMVPLLQELSDHLGATDMAAIRDILSEIQDRILRFDRGLDRTPE